MTSLRDGYKDQTRERILDAVLEQMAASPTEDLTVGQVAKRAGITERTVFRHFPTKDALVEAVWPRMQARVGSTGFPRTADDLIATPTRLFPEFDHEEGLVRASVYSAGGREVRLRSNDLRQSAMRDCVRDAWPDLDPAALERLAAVCQLINSAYGWSLMKDFWGLDGEESGRAGSEAIAVLLGRRPAGSQEPGPQT